MKVLPSAHAWPRRAPGRRRLAGTRLPRPGPLGEPLPLGEPHRPGDEEGRPACRRSTGGRGRPRRPPRRGAAHRRRADGAAGGAHGDAGARPSVFVDDLGHSHDYLLADRRVRISYDARRRYFASRQITRLDPVSGHQTQVVTTRNDPDAALVAQAMFSRWRQENFFRYQRAHYAHYALDALDAYETEPDDPARLVPNPARLVADRAVREATRMIETAHTNEGKASRDGRRLDKELSEAFAAAESETNGTSLWHGRSRPRLPSPRSAPWRYASTSSARGSWTRSGWRPTTRSQRSHG